MTNYEPITFGKLSEAIAYLEDGGELFVKINDACDLTKENIGKVGESELCLYGAWKSTSLHTKQKPAPWHEKLDGTVENGVLCWICDNPDEGRCIDAVVGYDGARWLTSSPYSSSLAWDLATPLTRAEIQRFMDNAPEEV